MSVLAGIPEVKGDVIMKLKVPGVYVNECPGPGNSHQQRSPDHQEVWRIRIDFPCMLCPGRPANEFGGRRKGEIT